MGAYASNLAFPVRSLSKRTCAAQCKGKNVPFSLRNIAFLLFFFAALGISATSEDIPNKIEDLRSECSSDFGGKDSVTSPDGEESVHGRKIPAFYLKVTINCCPI